LSQPPGWYPNSSGQMQWWDGSQWGQLQQQQAPPPPVGGYAPAPYAAPGYGYGPQLPAALQGRELASWGIRVGATLIDAIIFIVAIAIGVGLILAAGGGTVVGYLLGLVISYAVIVALLARQGEKNGMTLGKQVCNIRVVKEDGAPVTVGFALLREVVVRQLLIGFVGGLAFGIPGLLDILWPLWDDKNQTLHDKLVSSYVVRT
jgi:uncharacterized RDD family membrane protein YckC